MTPWSGCPCGCLRTRYLDDPNCVIHKPIGPAIDYAALNGYSELPDAA